MQTFKPILIQNLRRAALVMGFAMFVIFAHKASNEVSSPNIAAGSQRQQTLVALSPGTDSLRTESLAGEHALTTVASTQSNKDPGAIYTNNPREPSRENNSQPPRDWHGSRKDRAFNVTANGKIKLN